MKNLFYISMCCIIALNSCSSQKKLQESAPFTLGAASCQDWVGGREESGKGQILKIAVSELKAADISLQNVYFRGKMAPIVMEMEENTMMAVANFYDKKPDIIMHADATKEVGNQPPVKQSGGIKEFPFELSDSEAVLSYLENNKLKYFKIEGIKEKPRRIYPSRPKN